MGHVRGSTLGARGYWRSPMHAWMTDRPQYLTRTGRLLLQGIDLLRRSVPFVSYGRYRQVQSERDRLLHECHLLACRLNRAELIIMKHVEERR